MSVEELTAQLTLHEESNSQLNELKLMMQAMNTNVETLGKTLNQKIDNLASSTSKLAERVEEVNREIRDDFQKLETKLDTDIGHLKRESASIRETIALNKDAVDTKTATMQRELEEAYVLLDVQKKKFTALEKSSQRGMQHARGWNIEIDGLPAAVGDDPEDLEEALLKILDGIGVQIEDYEIDTIHRLPSRQDPKPVIVRFVTRKTVRAIHDKKHKLKYLGDMNLEINGLNEDSRIFLRPSLSPYFNNLSYNCRLLKRKRLIGGVKLSGDGKISVVAADGRHIKVTHESDLTNNFPLFDEFNFDYDRSLALNK